MSKSPRRAPRDKQPKVRLPSEIWVLVGAAFIVAFGFGFVSPVLPQFAASFDVGVMASTVVVSAFAFFRLIMAPASGRLVNRLGERTVYVTGILIVAASTYLCGLAGDYWQLLLFRALGGLGSSMFTISATALIIRLSPAHARARATGTYASAFLVGTIIGPVVGGLLAGFGMRVPFFIYGTGLVIAAVLVRLRLGTIGARRRSDVAPEDGTGAAEAGAGTTSPTPMRIREAWRYSAYRAALVGGLANGWAAMGVRTSLYPLFVVQALHAKPSAAGLALTMFALGNTVSVAAVGRFSDRLGRKPFVLAGLAVLAVTTFLVGFVHNLPLFLLFSAVGGLGAGMMNPSLQATVADVVGPDRPAGRVVSRFQMAQDTGSIFGPIVAGWLADSYGYGAAFGVSAALVVVALLSWLPAKETVPR